MRNMSDKELGALIRAAGTLNEKTDIEVLNDNLRN